MDTLTSDRKARLARTIRLLTSAGFAIIALALIATGYHRPDFLLTVIGAVLLALSFAYASLTGRNR